MKLKFNCILAACLSVAFSYSLAQTTAPLEGPVPEDNTPKPFYYPPEFATPDFTFDGPIGYEVHLGTYTVRLGQTRLSSVTGVLGGELHHLPDRTDYLCYSAPLEVQKKPVQPKRGKAQEPVEELPPIIGQNIWLVVGERGRITEARIDTVREGAALCPKLDYPFNNFSIGPLKLGLTEKQVRDLKLPTPSYIPDQGGWAFWFSRKALFTQVVGVELFGVQIDADGDITRMISFHTKLKEE